VTRPTSRDTATRDAGALIAGGSHKADAREARAPAGVALGASPSLRLLVAEDSEDDYELLLRELRKGGYAVVAARVDSAEGLSAALGSPEPWDLIIVDWIMPGFGGRAALALVAERRVAAPCIVISGTPGEEPAVQALRAGALDFLSKDKPRRLVTAVQRALREAADSRARRVAEQELRLSEERYRKGFEISPEVLVTYDLDRARVLDANSRALQFFGRAIEELRAIPLGSFSPPLQPDGRSSVDAAHAHVAAARAGASVTFPWTYAVGGELVPAEVTLLPLPTSGRNLARLSIVDLRERLRNEEIRRRSVELELQNQRIQEANRLKSEFLANMSHELRTPLNAIIGFAELLYDGHVAPGAPEHREFLGDILASGRHLLQLINDVLDLAKVEAGKLSFHPEPVELSRLLGEVTAILRTTAAHKRIRLEAEADPCVDGVVLDPARFKQVAYNYLSNALKFTAAGGRVIARVRAEGEDWIRFEVEDNGIGIAPSDLGRLFSEFQQLEAGASKPHQGTGLGLALTRRLVEAQGGSVGVRSVVGEGTTFHAILPRHAAVREADARAGAAVEVRAPADARTVLVVEDDERDRAQVIAALQGCGLATEVAATGAEGLARWRARSFDAVTIDLLLPDMSGLELLAAIQRERGARRVPIIVITVVPDERVVAGLDVHAVLPKPLDRDRLLAALQRAGVAPREPVLT
jgi:signal transduction histidine kinase